MKTLLVVALVLVACGAPATTTTSDGGTRSDAAIAPRSDAGEESDAAVVQDLCAAVTATAADLDNYAAVVACLKSDKDQATRLAARDTFVRAVEAHDGFPIVGGGKVIFVYVSAPEWDVEDDDLPDEDYAANRRREPLRVAGDFNAWNATDTVLEALPLGFFHRSVALTPEAKKRVGYKFIAKDDGGKDVYFSDPLSRRFQYDANGRLSFVRGNDSQGHLEWVRNVRATKLAVDRRIYVYVPRNYDWVSKRYPVLYMHDGQNLFDPLQPDSAPGTWDADGTADAEIAAGRVKELLIFGVPNDSNRFGEYTHVKDNLTGKTEGGDGDRYVDYLVNDLKPAMDRRYRTLTTAADTGVIGSSLGGLISLYIGLKAPDTFKYVGGMSSTFEWGEGLGNPTVPSLYRAAAPGFASKGQVYYLDSGGGPPQGGACIGLGDGSDNYCGTLAMKKVLDDNGVSPYPDDPSALRVTPDGIRIEHWFEPGAQHTESSWRARLFRPLRLFFRP